MNTLRMYSYPFSFSKISGRLVKRVNRFVVEAEVKGRIEQAYLPNPGRLWELLLPGTELMLSPDLSRGKMAYTVLACRKNGLWVLLHTHLTNKIIHCLVDEGRLRDFENYRVIQEEPACGRHRFDLLLKHRNTGAECYLEVKTCTLFAGRVAMFPDAVTNRGSEHLLKLKEISAAGIKTACLFVVLNPETEYFLPAYHIDPGFAAAFKEVKEQVQLSAVALGFDAGFSEIETIKPLLLPFDLLNAELQDGGAYLLLISLKNDRVINAGGLGPKFFKSGCYIYVGSAKRNLSKRMARHTRKRKQKRWHIDYLIGEAVRIIPVPIITADDLECGLADALCQIADNPVKGFGSSDCRCNSHLFYFAKNPLQQPCFIDLIQDYRIRRLEQKLDNLTNPGFWSTKRRGY